MILPVFLGVGAQLLLPVLCEDVRKAIKSLNIGEGRLNSQCFGIRRQGFGDCCCFRRFVELVV